jgi:hypothetical protein
VLRRKPDITADEFAAAFTLGDRFMDSAALRRT